MSIRSRPYVDDDLSHLQAALADWSRASSACGYYHVGMIPHWIYATLRGCRPVGDLVQVWEDGASIVGFAINYLFETAFQVFTTPSWRGTDAELAMLQLASETTRRIVQEAKQDRVPTLADISVVTDVFSCDFTRMELLAQLGFKQYRLWDHIAERSLSEPIPQAHLPDGFRIRRATMEDYPQLALVRNDAFGSDWTPEQYRDQVMQKPGYQPEREIVVVAADERIAAFAVTWLDPLNKVGLFEPVGTVREFRRRGLGRAIMSYALDEMKHLGMETAAVEYDAANVAARELYRSLGFSKKYETLGYIG